MIKHIEHLLHDDDEIFKELILLTSNHFKIDPSHVEKDYWITHILNQLQKSEFKNNVYFKGGTCLFKAYGIIKRFSEDLDLYVDTNEIHGGDPERKLNSSVLKFLIQNNEKLHVVDELNRDIERGLFCKTNFKVNNVFDIYGLKQFLQVELSISSVKKRIPVYQPKENRTINSLIGNYLYETNNGKFVHQYGLKNFTVPCIKPEKTLCDKISRMIRLSYEENPGEKISNAIRDLYDITMLLSNDRIKDFIRSEEFINGLYYTFLQDKEQHKYSHCDNDFKECILFTETDDLLTSPQIVKSYNELNKLLVNNEINKLPPIEKLSESIKLLKPIIEKEEKLRQTKINTPDL